MRAPIGSPCRCGGTHIKYENTTKCNRCGTFVEGWQRRTEITDKAPEHKKTGVRNRLAAQ